jgi:hypothetical protein
MGGAKPCKDANNQAENNKHCRNPHNQSQLKILGNTWCVENCDIGAGKIRNDLKNEGQGRLDLLPTEELYDTCQMVPG